MDHQFQKIKTNCCGTTTVSKERQSLEHHFLKREIAQHQFHKRQRVGETSVSKETASETSFSIETYSCWNISFKRERDSTTALSVGKN